MSLRILVTGGTGFVGKAVVARLLQDGHAVRVLVHQKTPKLPEIETFSGSVLDASAVRRAASGCDAIIHLVGIIEEHGDATFHRMHVVATRTVIDAAKAEGVGRYVHMSALGTRAEAISDYHRTKWQAEQIVRQDAPPWTLFRPSMILGDGGMFQTQLESWAKGQAAPWFFMPYFGKGVTGFAPPATVQPVHVDDVAAAFAGSMGEPKTVGRIYNVTGPDVFTWPQMLHRAAERFRGKPKAALPIPAWWARLLTRVTPAAMLPFNRAQVQMAVENNVGDNTELRQDLGWSPREVL